MKILYDLYDSEINYSISTFWDGGLTVKLGDEMNGFVDERSFQRGTHEKEWEEAFRWLESAACIHYPDSEFAKSRKDKA